MASFANSSNTKTADEKFEEHPDVMMFQGLRIKMYDPQYELTETERAMYPEVRAKAYMVRDEFFNEPCVTGKSKEERLEVIQDMLHIHPVWVKNHVHFQLERHLKSLLDSYLKSDDGERPDVNLREEEEKFMNSPKIKTFYHGIEEKKKRCDELMKYDNDFDLYKAMTDEEISDFI